MPDPMTSQQNESRIDGKNSRGQWVCGVPCHYGGLSMARKYAHTDFGYIWQCNQPVRERGQRCYRHKSSAYDAPDFTHDSAVQR